MFWNDDTPNGVGTGKCLSINREYPVVAVAGFRHHDRHRVLPGGQ